MAINFPNSPTDGQIFYDPTSGNRYIYSTSKGRWSVASNNSPFIATADKQVLFNNQNSIDGDAGLVFDSTANTLTANTINAYSMRVTGNLYVGSNTVTISNNSISAQELYVLDSGGNRILVASGNTDVSSPVKSSYETANSAFAHSNSVMDKTNTSFAVANSGFGLVNTAFGVANAAFGQSNGEVSRLSAAYVVANGAYTYTNSAYTVANAGFGIANSAVVNAAAAYAAVNTLATSANAYAASVGTSTNNYTSATYSTLTQFGSVFGVANAAYGQANTAYSSLSNYLPLAGGTMSGALNIGTSTNLSFGAAVRQMINLFNTDYAIGIQNNTQYYRSASRFSWHRGGSHSNTENDPGSGGTSAMTLDSSSNLTAVGSMRSPIFYDSDNTSYYINAAGYSNIYDISIYSGFIYFQSTGHKRITSNDGGGNWNFRAGNYMDGGSLKYINNGSGNSGAATITFSIDQSDGVIGFYTAPTGTAGATVSYTGSSTFNRYGTWETNGDFRAPIFYDTNDTGYYTDPNSISRMYGVNINYLRGSRQINSVYNSSNTLLATPTGIEFDSGSAFIHFTNGNAIAPYATYRSSGDWPAPYGIGWGNGGESSGIFQRYSSGGSFGEMIFYIGNDGAGSFAFRRGTWEGTTYNASGSNQYDYLLTSIDWSGNLTGTGSVRGPIFYDNGNTGYYCDPAATSNINALTVSGTTSGLINSKTTVSVSGTSVSITDIPSGVKRVTVMFNSVVSNSNQYNYLQVGSGSTQTTGYASSANLNGSGQPNITNAFQVMNRYSSSIAFSGIVTLTHMGSNVWAMNGVLGDNANARVNTVAGRVTLSGALDRVVLIDSTGAAFTSGSINVLYE